MTVLGAGLFGLLAGFFATCALAWHIAARRAGSASGSAPASGPGSNEIDPQNGRCVGQTGQGDWVVFWTVCLGFFAAGIITSPVLAWLWRGVP